MIAIVDYGMGNLGSIRNMLLKIGAESVIASEIDVIEAADKLILPGVGAFDRAMQSLESLELIPVLNRQVLEKKVPMLGICLGMQLFSKDSEEGVMPGLGWIDAHTIKFKFDEANAHLRLPHMGWNTVQVEQDHPVAGGIGPDSRFYFVHTFHVCCNDKANVLTTTNYGINFHSAVVKDNIIGTQFHPEKSHKFGIELLRNYSEA